MLHFSENIFLHLWFASWLSFDPIQRFLKYSDSATRSVTIYPLIPSKIPSSLSSASEITHWVVSNYIFNRIFLQVNLKIRIHSNKYILRAVGTKLKLWVHALIVLLKNGKKWTFIVWFFEKCGCTCTHGTHGSYVPDYRHIEKYYAV